MVWTDLERQLHIMLWFNVCLCVTEGTITCVKRGNGTIQVRKHGTWRFTQISRFTTVSLRVYLHRLGGKWERKKSAR